MSFVNHAAGTSFAVFPKEEALISQAEHIAERIGGVVCRHMPDRGLLLLLQSGGLWLQDLDSNFKPINIDFASAALTHRRRAGGGKQQAVAKAVGVTSKDKPSVLDATAGLGEDAFVLASLGCSVQMVERHPVIAALLQDALARANSTDDAELKTIANRMSCQTGDIRSIHLDIKVKPDVVYLDPMFPERKKSALVKKEMRIVKALVGDDLDADELLPAALALATRRVVVKRPAQAPFLMGKKPHHQLVGKANRFDIYQV